MITTSANYKTAIKAVSREIRAYLKFNGSTIYRGVDGLVSINWNAQLFDKERFCVNCANAAYIEAEMYGEPIQNLESAYVEAYIGVVLEYKSAKPSGSIEDDTADVEYVKLGRFDVTEVVRKNGKVMISAYDRMAKLSENYVTTVTPTDDGYSKSAIVTDIKNQCGLTWSQSFSGYVPEIVNSTMRDQLCWLYGSTTSTGQSLMLSRDGTTVISKVIVGQTALNYTIDESTTYLDGLNDQPSFTITSYSASDGENTYSYGSGAGVEVYNPYISSATANSTYNSIKNFSYTPMVLEFRGDPAIELGDILTVTSGNNSYSVVVMKMATVFNGGLKTTIYCYGNTEEWDAISNSPTGARIIQTENMVRIEAARATEAEGELAASITTTADGILSTVSQTYQAQANAAVVNLLPSVYYRENDSGKTWVNNGVTWTVNNDGSVTATGTATGAVSDYYLSSSSATDSVPWIIVDPAKKHILSGGINSNAYIATGYIANPGDTWAWATSSSSATGTATIPLGAKYLRVFLRIAQGYAIPTGGVTFYPMLEVGDTAHPYVSTHNGTGALENRMVSAESAIVQNANDITLKVSESDVTGNYVIGKINLNSTTATIAAEHINLQGAVRISSLNSDAQAATLNSNIVVGGRNYFKYSNDTSKYRSYAPTGYNVAVVDLWENMVVGKTYTITIWGDAPTVSNKSETWYACYWGGGNISLGRIYISNGVGHITFVAPNTTSTEENNAWINIYNTPPFETGQTRTASITAVKLEEGNKSTDWSPAPEDTDSAISTAQTTANTAIANTPVVNILPSVYYRENQSGKTVLSYGITWTVNADGSVTASGTATANTNYNLSLDSATANVPWIQIDPSKQHTMSGVPNVTGCHYRVQVFDSSGTAVATYQIDTESGNGIKRTIPSGYYYAYAYLRIVSGTVLPSGGVTFKPMLEVGDTAHAYVSTHNGTGAIMAAAVASTVSCYYRSTTSTTPTISTSTSIGTSASTDNSWEYVMPYPKKNAYFFTCEKYTHADGSISFSTVRSLSNADYTSKWCSSSDSTYIDGGNIYTGTVNANAIKANETFTQKLYATDFNLTGGSVNIQTASSTEDKIVLNYSTESTHISAHGFQAINTSVTYGDPDRAVLLSYDGLRGSDIKVSSTPSYVQGFYLYDGHLTLRAAIDSNTSYNQISLNATDGTIFVYHARNKYSALMWPDSNGAGRFVLGDGTSTLWRTELTNSGLVFRNSSDAVTASYPADGFPLTTHTANWVCTTDWTEALSFTLAKGDYLIELYHQYSNVRPWGIGMATYSGTNFYWTMREDVASLSDGPSGYNAAVSIVSAYIHLSANTTYHVFAKTQYASTLTNKITAYVKQIP